MPKRPNIILCICDQLRAFELGCYGNPVIRTPNVDRLAAEGVRFDPAVTNSAVCMAARSVLLSGQYNRTCTGGVGNVSFPSWPGDSHMPEYPIIGRPHVKDRTLPEALREIGYHNAVIGKWHIHSWPDDIGFDDYLIPRVHHCHSGQSFTYNGGPEFVPQDWSVEFEAERVERFIASRRSAAEPFFLYYSISPPHCPVADAPERYLSMYSPEEVPLRPNVDLDRPLDDPHRPNESQDRRFKVYRHDFRHYSLHLPYTETLPEGYDLRWLIAEYYGVTTWMDDAVGRMLAALDDAGLADDTVVVFTSDHGDNLGSHGLVQKGGPNEEAARIPLVFRHPASLAPRVVGDRVAGLVDVAPTLLQVAGAELPGHMAGHSLLPAMLGQPQDDARRHAFMEMGNMTAVRSPTHMYALRRNPETRELGPAPFQFFDLVRDPYQLDNMAGTEAQAETAGELDALVREYDRETPWMEA